MKIFNMKRIENFLTRCIQNALSEVSFKKDIATSVLEELSTFVGNYNIQTENSDVVYTIFTDTRNMSRTRGEERIFQHRHTLDKNIVLKSIKCNVNGGFILASAYIKK